MTGSQRGQPFEREDERTDAVPLEVPARERFQAGQQRRQSAVRRRGRALPRDRAHGQDDAGGIVPHEHRAAIRAAMVAQAVHGLAVRPDVGDVARRQ